MAVLITKKRELWIDVARGGAIVAMIVYHFSFDLSFFHVVDWPVSFHPAWRAFAASIASTFLFLVGVGLVRAHANGVKWRAFWRRFAIIAACAGAVTLGTMFTMPAPVYFGILHAIAAFSALALAFVFIPPALTFAAALFVLTAPLYLTSPLFSAPVFYPLGLAPERPFTFDYEPIFPWFSVVLLGVAFARFYPGKPRMAPAPPVLGPLLFAGRHSLVIYLVHQPILFAVLIGLRRAGLV